MTAQPKKQKFHHRHFPHFIKWGKALFWRLSHLYFVIFIHYMTDKYEGKRHHLVVDMIYGVITFGLVAVNLGIGIWFIQHHEAPQFDMEMITASQTTSGQSMNIATIVASLNRDVEDVTVSVYVPKDFVKDGKQSGGVHEQELGSVLAGDVHTIEHSGVIFGNKGDVQAVSAIAQYRYRDQTFYAVKHRKIEIDKTSFKAKINFPKNVAAGFPTTGTIRFNNNSDVDREEVEFLLRLPSNFELQSIRYKKKNLDYDLKKNRIVIPKIKAGQRGKIQIIGTFTPATEQDGIIGGDQESEISLRVRSRVAGGIIENTRPYVHVPSTVDTVRVIEPRVVASVSGTAVARFGESVVYTVTVTNTGDAAASNVQLYGTASGSGLAPFGGTVVFPVIEKLKVGETQSVSVYIPTVANAEINPVGQLTVTGSAYAPLVDFDIPIAAGSAQTRFTSQASVAASSVYSQGGEQLGYGPYPPRANEPTAMLVVLRVDNINNALAGATIQTTLPSQVQWSGETSVSAGSPLTYDPATRTVSWNIGTVPPQNGVLGAQFEVVLLPNSDQVGLSPQLTSGWSMSAVDTFTGQGVSAFAPAQVTAAVEPEPKQKDGTPVDEIIVEDGQLGDIIIE